MIDLERAIAIALEAHSGQFDKAGEPYVLHPLRLMLKFKESKERIVALLHDVIEDSDITLSYITECGFSKEIVEALECLSRRSGESYDEFIVRVSLNRLAKKIKIEDLKDNMDLTRLEFVSEVDLKRVAKYHKALKNLLSC